MVDLYQEVGFVQRFFDDFSCKYLLMNGNLEKPYKALLGMALEEGRDESISYAMDKKIHGHEIDIIAFEESEVVNLTELKFTFSIDGGACYQAAVKASMQILRTIDVAPKRDCYKQIIHVMNGSDPRSILSKNPDWIKNKYPSGGRRITLSDLEERYRVILGSHVSRCRKVRYKFPEKFISLEALVIDVV
ncbi:hypothetical protein CEK62_04225 [Alcanivorax sp. N3-2A]|nr:hypothetical protein CEK62_04225 [Alcanivorax sp. N3-2A]